MVTIVLTAAAFLLGSFPTGVLLVRMFSGTDVRQVGSGNIGAANVARTAGMKIGLLVAIVDMLKGAVAVIAGLTLGLDHAGLAVIALAAVLGHDFSLFLRFRGGKGVATTLGVAVVLMPVVTLIALAVWVATMLTWRYSSLASLLALGLLPVAAAITVQPHAYVLLTAGLFLLAAYKHWDNIIRLWYGTERKFQRARPANGG